MSKLPKFENENLIVGLETSDDAAVYKINKEILLIQTVDFFTPVVDDPYIFGQIAAANSLSDIYAMGGDPAFALNIIGFPNCLSPDVMAEILKGGASKVLEANAVIAGGHSIEDDEPKYGLCVTGFVKPERLLKNYGAKPGDVLILTKPIGTGIITTAIKGSLCSDETKLLAIKYMSELNKYAKETMESYPVNSCTDITGFGFLGHSCEMAVSSNVTFEIDGSKIPIMGEAKEYAQMGLIPGGTYRNRNYFSNNIDINTDEIYLDLLFDPQTSGGLLFSVNERYSKEIINNNNFYMVGKVKEKQNKSIILV